MPKNISKFIAFTSKLYSKSYSQLGHSTFLLKRSGPRLVFKHVKGGRSDCFRLKKQNKKTKPNKQQKQNKQTKNPF